MLLVADAPRRGDDEAGFVDDNASPIHLRPGPLSLFRLCQLLETRRIEGTEDLLVVPPVPGFQIGENLAEVSDHILVACPEGDCFLARLDAFQRPTHGRAILDRIIVLADRLARRR